jgi:hypothetical protein
MDITYEIMDDEGIVIQTVTGTKLREHFGVGPTNPIFNEKLVIKFNLIKECEGSPERMRQTISILETENIYD